jgi:hypothetical protein
MRFLLGKSMNLTGYSEEIFPTPHTLHPTPRLDFNLVVTPSEFWFWRTGGGFFGNEFQKDIF